MKKTVQEILDAPLTKREQKDKDDVLKRWPRLEMFTEEEKNLFDGYLRLGRLKHDWGKCETSGMDEEYCRCLNCFPDDSLNLEIVDGHYYQRCLHCTKPFLIPNGESGIYCESCKEREIQLRHKIHCIENAEDGIKHIGTFEVWYDFYLNEFYELPTTKARMLRVYDIFEQFGRDMSEMRKITENANEDEYD